MMQRLVLLVLLLVAPLGSWSAEIPPTEVMGMLGSREMLGQVGFAAGSDLLDQVAMEELDRIAVRLADLSKGNKLIRVEGFCAVQDGAEQTVGLAMARARAVETYLREVKKLTKDIYLSGQGSEGTNPASPRVEIAVYDMLLPISDAPVDNIIRTW